MKTFPLFFFFFFIVNSNCLFDCDCTDLLECQRIRNALLSFFFLLQSYVFSYNRPNRYVDILGPHKLNGSNDTHSFHFDITAKQRVWHLFGPKMTEFQKILSSLASTLKNSETAQRIWMKRHTVF